MKWILDKDLDRIREEFPILSKCVYLLSNSLGAVPRQTKKELERFYSVWAEYGATAWEQEWWDMARRVGQELSLFLRGGGDTITMLSNATQCHWIALSTQFKNKNRRNKIIMTDHDFPSILYAVNKIAEFTGWSVDMIESRGEPGIDAQRICERIDDNTLFVATSHVYFKTSYVQDIARIARKARQSGALTLIDGFHAPGTLPVDLSEMDIDFYVGGCLKWLCGGPGNAFLYVHPGKRELVNPLLTGWFAHKRPFDFDTRMEYADDSYRFLSGTPSIPNLYTISSGLNIIKSVGIEQIRNKSIRQTAAVIDLARRQGYKIYSPEEKEKRGGAVSLSCPHASRVRMALESRGFIVDFRKGRRNEPDVMRIAPHFYTKDEEIEELFTAWADILHIKEYEKFPPLQDR